jgi:hypothetical protein
MGPPLSSLLLNMKSEDTEQGPALKNNRPDYIGSMVHHWYQIFPKSYDKKSLFFVQGSILLFIVEICPKVSCRSPSWCP